MNAICARTECLEDGVLVWKEVVQRSHGRAGALSDELHRGPAHAMLAEDLRRRLEDLRDTPLPPLLLRGTRHAVSRGVSFHAAK